MLAFILGILSQVPGVPNPPVNHQPTSSNVFYVNDRTWYPAGTTLAQPTGLPSNKLLALFGILILVSVTLPVYYLLSRAKFSVASTSYETPSPLFINVTESTSNHSAASQIDVGRVPSAWEIENSVSPLFRTLRRLASGARSFLLDQCFTSSCASQPQPKLSPQYDLDTLNATALFHMLPSAEEWETDITETYAALESDYATEVLDELKPTAVDWHPIVESTRPVATFHYPTCAATPFPYAERIVAPPRVETVYVHDGVSVLWFIPITIAFAALSVMLYKKWTLLKSAVEVLSWTWQLSDKVHGEDKKRIADADATSLLQLAQIDALQVLLTQEKKEVVAKHEIIVGKMGKIERLETQLHQAELEARNDVQQVELARLRRAEVEKDAGLARSNARMETLQQTIEMHKALLAVSDKKEEVMKAEKANLEQTKTNLERKADILDKALSFSRGQLKESESECLSLRESVERTTNELRSTESELKQHAEREIELASELDEARKQLQAKDRRIGDLTTSSMQSRKAVDTLEDKLSQSLTKVQTLDLELQKAKLSQDGAAKDIEELSLRLEQQLRAMEEARMERDHAYAEKDDADRSRDEAIRERDEATHGRDEAIRDRDELTYQMEEVRQNVELILCEQEKRKIELAEAASQIQSSVSQLNEEQSRSKTLQQENELIKQLLTEAGSQLEAAQAKIKDHERFEVSMFDVAFSLGQADVCTRFNLDPAQIVPPQQHNQDVNDFTPSTASTNLSPDRAYDTREISSAPTTPYPTTKDFNFGTSQPFNFFEVETVGYHPVQHQQSDERTPMLDDLDEMPNVEEAGPLWKGKGKADEQFEFDMSSIPPEGFPISELGFPTDIVAFVAGLAETSTPIASPPPSAEPRKPHAWERNDELLANTSTSSPQPSTSFIPPPPAQSPSLLSRISPAPASVSPPHAWETVSQPSEPSTSSGPVWVSQPRSPGPRVLLRDLYSRNHRKRGIRRTRGDRGKHTSSGGGDSEMGGNAEEEDDPFAEVAKMIEAMNREEKSGASFQPSLQTEEFPSYPQPQMYTASASPPSYQSIGEGSMGQDLGFERPQPGRSQSARHRGYGQRKR